MAVSQNSLAIARLLVFFAAAYRFGSHGITLHDNWCIGYGSVAFAIATLLLWFAFRKRRRVLSGIMIAKREISKTVRNGFRRPHNVFCAKRKTLLEAGTMAMLEQSMLYWVFMRWMTVYPSEHFTPWDSQKTYSAHSSTTSRGLARQASFPLRREHA